MAVIVIILIVCSVLGVGVLRGLMEAFLIVFCLVLIAGAIGFMISKHETDWRCNAYDGFADQNPDLCP